jgi:hypothetical protein
MTTAEASSRPRPARLTAALSADAALLSGLALLVGLLCVATWGTWGDLGADTGYDVLAGARVADGELPYVDFVYYYGPLAPAALALATLLGGATLGPALVLGLALASLIVVAVYALARFVSGPLGAFLAAAITAPVAFAPNNLSFVLPHAASAPLAILATLCFLLALAHFAHGGRTAWLGVAGASAGIVALTRPEFAAAVLAAGLAWLVLRAHGGRVGPREALTLAAPACALPAFVYGAFATAIGPGALIFENLYPRDVLEAAGNAVLRTHAPLTVGSFVELGGRLLLYLAGLAILLLVAGRLERGRLPLARVIAFGGAAVAGAVLAARPETVRYGLEFAYGWIPAGAVLGLALLLRRNRRSSDWSPAAQVQLLTGVVLAVLAAKTYAAFFIHAPKPQYAVYALPFAAVLLAGLHLRELARTRSAHLLGAVWLAFLAAAGTALTIKDARVDSSTVRGPGGEIAAPPAEAAAYNGALGWIEEQTRPGEPILLAPQLTTLYTLSERDHPLRELALQPGALPDGDAERAAIARLEQAGVRLAIVDTRAFPEFRHSRFGDSFDPILARWIDRHFHLVAQLPAESEARVLQIWLRGERR